MCHYACLDGREVDLQYSHWEITHPRDDSPDYAKCAVDWGPNVWLQQSCYSLQIYICQSE